MQKQSKEKGLTIVGVKLYIADNGYAKILIALARGKKEYDKRASIKEKDYRIFKNFLANKLLRFTVFQITSFEHLCYLLTLLINPS